MNYTINKMLGIMRTENLKAHEVVEIADANFRKEYCEGMNDDSARAVLLGSFKAQMAIALDEIKRLRKELATYEEIKFDSEADVFSDEKEAA